MDKTNIYSKSDRPVPKPRRKLIPPQVSKPPSDGKPTPVQRPIVKQMDTALKGFTKSYSISLVGTRKDDLMMHLYRSRYAVEKQMLELLTELGGYKFVETFAVRFKKKVADDIILRRGYFNCFTKTVINVKDIKMVLQTSGQEIMHRVGNWMKEGSGWTIDALVTHYINIAKYKPLSGKSYIILPAELRHHMKGLINIKNKDDQCFRWCHIRLLNPQDKDAQRIKESDKEWVDKLDYSGVEFPVATKNYSRIE